MDAIAIMDIIGFLIIVPLGLWLWSAISSTVSGWVADGVVEGNKRLELARIEAVANARLERRRDERAKELVANSKVFLNEIQP